MPRAARGWFERSGIDQSLYDSTESGRERYFQVLDGMRMIVRRSRRVANTICCLAKESGSVCMSAADATPNLAK